MKTTLRYVLPLDDFFLVFLLAPTVSPAPIIYREGEGIVPSEVQDIEIKKNAQEAIRSSSAFTKKTTILARGGSVLPLGWSRRFPRR